jgi:hypothetical protein
MQIGLVSWLKLSHYIELLKQKEVNVKEKANGRRSKGSTRKKTKRKWNIGEGKEEKENNWIKGRERKWKED